MGSSHPNITLEQLMEFNEKDGAFSKYRFYQQFTDETVFEEENLDEGMSLDDMINLLTKYKEQGASRVILNGHILEIDKEVDSTINDVVLSYYWVLKDFADRCVEHYYPNKSDEILALASRIQELQKKLKSLMS